MVEVSGGQEQDASFFGEDFAQSFANLYQRIVIKRSQCYRNEGESGIEDLQERDLYLEGMFTLVGHRVLKEQFAGMRDSCSKIGVDRRVTQRSAPDASRNHGGIFPVREMADTEDDDSLWKGDVGENGARDGS